MNRPWETECAKCGKAFVVDSVARSLTGEYRLAETLGEEFTPGINPFTGEGFKHYGSSRKYCYGCSPRGSWKGAPGSVHRRYYAEYSRRYYEDNRERISRYKKRWAKTESGRRSQSLNQERRRAHKINAFVEDVELDVLAETFNSTCGICKLPVNFEAELFSSLHPVKDHIVPLSKGGEHSYGNMQLAHWSCNAQKHNKLDGWQNIKPILNQEEQTWLEQAQKITTQNTSATI